LKFLGGFRHQFPVIPAVLRVAARQHRRATGEALDILRAGWRPPLEPETALAVESRQIEELGLRAMVSLSDHDTIEAATDPAMRRHPISLEWTVPFGPTFFHIGIHNLPRTQAAGICAALNEATLRPCEAAVAEALDLAARQPGVLVVLNHPLWDEAGIGADAHHAAVGALLARFGGYIDAIEWNGLRSRVENAAAARLAGEWSKPVISGGDRHGAEPNAAINLTNAASFEEFATEVRDGASAVLLMPQYREPLRLRWLQTVRDIVRTYPEAREGWRNWSDRFFYRMDDGSCRSVAEVWKTSRPPVISQVLSMLHLTGLPQLRPALRLVLADRQ
jgi:hypothetical protein